MILANIDAFIDETAEGVHEEIASGKLPTASGPTQHTQAALAFFQQDERWVGAVRIFEVTALARQGNPAPQAPPFTGYWVGDNWLVSLDKFGK